MATEEDVLRAARKLADGLAKRAAARTKLEQLEAAVVGARTEVEQTTATAAVHEAKLRDLLAGGVAKAPESAPAPADPAAPAPPPAPVVAPPEEEPKAPPEPDAEPKGHAKRDALHRKH